MIAKVIITSDEVQRAARESAQAVVPAGRDLIRELAIMALRGARKRVGGSAQGTTRVSRGKLPGAGAYPIPVRTGTLGRSLGMRTTASSAVIFSDAAYAQALHDGFRPYGNPHAMAIPARPYFEDAINEDLDIDAAHAAWERRMARQGVRL